jgi:hypothetical protein
VSLSLKNGAKFEFEIISSYGAESYFTEFKTSTSIPGGMSCMVAPTALLYLIKSSRIYNNIPLFSNSCPFPSPSFLSLEKFLFLK